MFITGCKTVEKEPRILMGDLETEDVKSIELPQSFKEVQIEFVQAFFRGGKTYAMIGG